MHTQFAVARRRALTIGTIIASAAAAFVLAIGMASGADADEWGLITNDPSPFGIQTVQAQYDARQDDTITLEAAVCRDNGILDDCGDIAPGSVSLNGPTAIEVQWDMTGDGTPEAIDDNGGAGFTSSQIDGNCPTGTTFYTATYCNLQEGFGPNFFGPSPPDGWDLQARICDVSGSPCSSWERWSIGGINTDYDIRCTPGLDNDGDGIPCEFEFPGGEVITNNDDRDNDAKFQRDALQCIDADVLGLPAVDLEMGLFGDFALAVFSNFCEKSINFFGNPIFTYFGGTFAWTDVTVTSGSVELAVANLITQRGFVSHNDDGTREAYFRGTGICTDPDAGTFAGSDFGFCNFRVAVQDDTDALTQDEFSIKVTGRGFFGTSFNKSYGFEGNGDRNSAESLASLAQPSFQITPG